MSPDIYKEIEFLWHALLLGAALCFFYDWFLVARKIIPHGVLAVSLEDLLFWALFAISIFVLLYEKNNGALRWFAVAGTFVGMFCYKKLFSGFFTKYAVYLFSFLFRWIGKLLYWIGKPWRMLKQKLGTGCHSVEVKGLRLGKYLKKKLTDYLKLFKITVDKR